MSVTVETAIDPATGEHFRCVFDAKTCLPVEPIQRFLNYCRKRGLAANTVETYAYGGLLAVAGVQSLELG
jgi:hypothetical protein